MKKIGKKRRTAPGAAPGAFVIDPEASPPRIDAHAYNGQEIEERNIERTDQIQDLLGRWPVVWINVVGLGDEAVMRSLGELFHIHPLGLEDVVNAHQRAKMEEFERHLYFATRLFNFEKDLQSEQISLFLGPNYVLTFQERAGDCFDPVRHRLRAGRGRIRTSGADYLAYALLDAVVDHYFPVLESVHAQLEDLSDRIFEDPRPEMVSRINVIKRSLHTLRRFIWPQREVFSAILRDPPPFISEAMHLYWRDCYDHSVQVMDSVDSHRELASSLAESYLSSVSHRMNEVMKVLTIIATLFIPLSFIVGLYGMNFNPEISPYNMPETQWRYGYLFVLGLLAAVGLAFVFFFWKKGWLGGGAASKRRFLFFAAKRSSIGKHGKRSQVSEV